MSYSYERWLNEVYRPHWAEKEKASQPPPQAPTPPTASGSGATLPPVTNAPITTEDAREEAMREKQHDAQERWDEAEATRIRSLDETAAELGEMWRGEGYLTDPLAAASHESREAELEEKLEGSAGGNRPRFDGDERRIAAGLTTDAAREERFGRAAAAPAEPPPADDPVDILLEAAGVTETAAPTQPLITRPIYDGPLYDPEYEAKVANVVRSQGVRNAEGFGELETIYLALSNPNLSEERRAAYWEELGIESKADESRWLANAGTNLNFMQEQNRAAMDELRAAAPNLFPEYNPVDVYIAAATEANKARDAAENFMPMGFEGDAERAAALAADAEAKRAKADALAQQLIAAGIEVPRVSGDRGTDTVKGSLKTMGADVMETINMLADMYTRNEAYSMNPEMYLAYKAVGLDPMEVRNANIDYYNSEEYQAYKAAAQARADALRESGAADIAAAKAGLDDFGQGLVDLGVAGVRLAGDAVLGSINPAYATASMAIQSFGGGAAEARAAGAGDLEQFLYGGAKALSAVGMGKLFDGVAGIYGKGFGDDFTEALVSKLASSETGKSVARFIINATGEGAEEFAEGALDPVLKLIYDEGETLKQIYSSPEAWADALVNNLYEGMIGAALSAGAQSVALASGGGGTNVSPTNSDAIDAVLETAGVTAPAEAETATAPMTPEQEVAQILSGTVTNSQANRIINDPGLRAAFEAEHGKLPPEHSKARATIKAAAATAAEAATETLEASGDIETVPAAAEADTAAQDVLNNGSDEERQPGTTRVRPTPRQPGVSRVTPQPRQADAGAETDVATEEQEWVNELLERAADAREVGFIEVAEKLEAEAAALQAQIQPEQAEPTVVDAAAEVAMGNQPETPAEAPPATDPRDILVETAMGETQTATESPAQPAPNPIAEEYRRRAEVARNAGDMRTAAEYERRAAEAETAAASPAPAQAASVPPRAGSNLGGGSRVSQTAGTVAEADITSDQRRAELEPYVQGGKFSYVPDTNKAQIRRAERAIANKGWTKAVEDFKADVAAGKSGKDLVAQGAVLLNNAANSTASAREYMDLVGSYIEMMHRAGETLQAGKIIQQLTPEGRLYLILKTQDKINRSLTTSQRNKAAKAAGVDPETFNISLDPALVEAYRNAATDAERDAIIGQMQQQIADQLPPTFGEQLTAFRYTAMLGNFKTQIRNLTGNALSLTTKLVKDRIAALGEMIVSAAGGNVERTRSFAYSPELGKAAWADFAEHRQEILGDGKYTSAAKQFEQGIQDKRRMLPPILEQWRKATQWGMEVGDAMFARAAYADALAGYLKAHGVDFKTASPELLASARAFAAKEAREATFRDSNQFSDFVTSCGSGWRRSNKGFDKVASAVLEGIAPFRKTPANVLARAEEYSPLGIVNTIAAATKVNKGEADVSDVINAAAKTATGTALMMAGYLLAGAGKLRGREDDEELDKAQKAAGAMDWSFVTDEGKHISLSQFAPATIPLFMGVRLMEVTEGAGLKDITPAMWADIIKAMPDPMLQMSMMSGLNDAFSGRSTYGDEEGAMGQFIENAMLSLVSQNIPALLGQMEQYSEDYRRTTYTDSSNPVLGTDAQYAISRASSRIPGWDYQQADYVDMWGRKSANDGSPASRFYDAFLNPTYTSEDRREEIDIALEDLHNTVKDIDGAPSVYPSFVGRNAKLGPNGETMSPEQYERYQIASGTRARELATDFYNSEEWDMLTPEQRAKTLDNLYSLADSMAKTEIRAEMGVSGEALKTDWDTEAELDDPVEYLANKAMMADASKGESRDYSVIDGLIADWAGLNADTQEALLGDFNMIDELVAAAENNVAAEAWFAADDAIDRLKEERGTDAGAVKLEAILSADLSPAEEAYLVSTMASKNVADTYAAFTGLGLSGDEALKFFLSADGSAGSEANNSLSQAEVYKALANVPTEYREAIWNSFGWKTSYSQFKP